MLMVEPYSTTPVTSIRYYSNSQDTYAHVHLNDVPYAIAIRPHPTCKNYEAYVVQFEIKPADISYVDFESGEFSPGEWIYPAVCSELNAFLEDELNKQPIVRDQLIKQELELCLA